MFTVWAFVVEAPSYLREIVEEENQMFLESVQQANDEMVLAVAY